MIKIKTHAILQDNISRNLETMIIYLDMDDVCADWTGAASTYLGVDLTKENERLPESQWDVLKQFGRFYRNLPLKEGADELASWCQRYCLKTGAELRFLTALPSQNDMPWAVQDKVWWAADHFPNIPVFIGPYSGDKWKHCQIGDVLIDDRESNCSDWAKAGGLAHVYRNWEQCQHWLKNTLPGAE